MKNVLKLTIFCIALAHTIGVSAQKATKKPLDTRANLLFGLNQPLLVGGFNIEGNFFYKRLVFDYSHGISLDFSGNTLTGSPADQKLAIHLPFTTGFGVGYRFTEWLNLRIEPKWHRFEVYYDGEDQTEANLITDYTTFSLGLGAYAQWRPFKNKENALKGIMIVPSVRYWPKLNSTLENDTFKYVNKITEKTETHEAMEVGIGNTPLIVNVSIGYSFEFKKKG
jgi:hypothetical protein